MRSLIAREAGIQLHTEADALALIGSGLPACILGVEDLHPQFFDLRNGIAGAIFQKLVNYEFRVAIVLPSDHGFGPRVSEMVRELRTHPFIRFFPTPGEAEAWAGQGAADGTGGAAGEGAARRKLGAPHARHPTLGGSTMQIHRNGSRPSQKGPATWFTGAVRIDPLNTAPAPARVAVASVTFEPGARTAWHTHPLGQTLVVTAGVGWTQCEGGPVVEIRAGDVIWCPPAHRHWHGATPTSAMTHIAIQEALDGKMVEWMEHVTDEQYRAGASAKAS